MRIAMVYTILILTLVLPEYSHAAELKALMAPWIGNSPEGHAVASKLYITNVPCKDKQLIKDELNV